MGKDRVHLDVWVRMYEEQIRHVRHHEALRSSSTNIAVVISAAVLGLLAADVIPDRQWVLPAFLVLINGYGLMMNPKHDERGKLHHAVASRYREVISEASKVGDCEVNELRRAAWNEHVVRRFWILRVRAYLLWCGLHALLAALGGFLLVLLGS